TASYAVGYRNRSEGGFSRSFESTKTSPIEKFKGVPVFDLQSTDHQIGSKRKQFMEFMARAIGGNIMVNVCLIFGRNVLNKQFCAVLEFEDGTGIRRRTF